MKKLCFLIFFFLLFSAVYAQTLEKTFRIQFETSIHKALASGNSDWLLTGFYKRYDQPISPPWVCKVDSNGHILWTNIVMQTGLEEGETSLAIKTEDGGFAVAGSLRSCDVGPDASFVRKLDAWGNTVWTYIYAEPINPQSGKFNTLTETADNGFLIGRDSLVLKLSSAGDSLWTRTPADGWINGVSEFGNGTLIFATTKGVSISDSLAVLQYSRPFLHSVGKLRIDPWGYIIVESDNILYRLDLSLNIIDSLVLNTWLTHVEDIQVDSNAVWVSGRSSGTNLEKLLVLNSNLSFSNLVSYNVPGTRINSIAYNQTKLLVSGHQESFTSKTAFIKTADKNGILNFASTDASISSISIANYFLVPISPQLPGLVDIYMDIDVSIVNMGLDTLRSIFLNAEMNFGFLCFKAVNFKEFSGFSIAPGDTSIIRFNGLKDYARDVNNPFGFKVWTSDPNRKLDKDISNDSLSVLMLFSGLPETYPPTFLIYPNPGSGTINLSGNDGVNIDLVSIYNIEGKKIFEQYFNDENSVQIDVSEKMKPGMYIIEISSEGRKYMSKLIRK